MPRFVADYQAISSAGVIPYSVARHGVPHTKRILEGMDALRDICREYSGMFWMLKRVLRPEHFAREVVELTEAFKHRDSEWSV